MARPHNTANIGRYPRTPEMLDNISTAAKARGATGFMKKPHAWCVMIDCYGDQESVVTKVTREALNAYSRHCKNAKDPLSKYHKATVRLICDGVEIKSNKT